MEKRLPLSSTLIPWLIFGGIVGVNLLLKVWQAGATSIYLDEAASIYAGQMKHADFMAFLQHDESPPLYYWLLRAWMRLFGDDLLILRSLSAGLSALAAGAVFWMGKRFFSNSVGLVAALLFTLSNLQFTYAQEVRCYALVGLLSVLSTYFFLGLLVQRRRSDLWGLMVVNVLLVGAHYATVALLVAQGMMALAWLRTDGRRVMRYGLSQVPTLIFCLVFVLGNVSSRKINNIATWFEAPTPKLFLQMMAAFSGYTLIAAVMLGLIAAAIGYLLWRTWRGTRPEKAGLHLVLLVWPILGLMIAWLMSQWAPFFTAKYLAYLGIGWLLSVVVALEVLPLGRIVKYGLTSGLLLWSLWLFKAEKPVLEDWKRAASVAKTMKKTGGIVITPAYQLKTFAYYYDREAFRDYENLARRMEAQQIIAVNKVEAGLFGPEVYNPCLLLQSHKAVTDPQGESQSYLAEQLPQETVVACEGIEITLFEGRKQGP